MKGKRFTEEQITCALRQASRGPEAVTSAGSHTRNGPSPGPSQQFLNFNSIKNNILGGRFGGYTAHHFTTSKHFHRRPVQHKILLKPYRNGALLSTMIR